MHTRQAGHVHTALGMQLDVEFGVGRGAEQVMDELVVDLQHAHVDGVLADVRALVGLGEELRQRALVDAPL